MTKVEKTFDRIEVLSLPLRNKFRGLETREVLLLKTERWAEFSPFAEYPDQECVPWLESALEWASSDLPAPKRDRIPVNAILPAVQPHEVEKALQPFRDFRTVKIKVAEKGQDFGEDLARIRRVIELMPQVRIRLDANGAWDVPMAIEFARLLQELEVRIEYLEQPVKTVDELSELREKFHNLEINFAIAADESIRKASDPFEVIHRQAADVLVLKNAPLGGIANCLRIADATNLGVAISSALESSIGLQSGLQLAASVDNLDFDCGLATVALFVEDVVDEPLLAHNGYIELRALEPSEKQMKKLAVSEERKQFWVSRLERVLELL